MPAIGAQGPVEPVPAGTGSLVVAGTGVGLGSQMTIETLEIVKAAECLLYVVNTHAAAAWLQQINPRGESLHGHYAPGKPRAQTYAEMVERILAEVRKGRRVVALFYGHPGVCVDPSHEAIRLARQEGYTARMLPGISAEACLYADLGFDPLTDGCQTYEASSFVVREPAFATSAYLVLWQVGVIGETLPRFTRDACQPGLERLRRLLLRHYPAGHEVVAYEAAIYPVFRPRIARGPLARVADLPVSPATTLVVPPVAATA